MQGEFENNFYSTACYQQAPFKLILSGHQGAFDPYQSGQIVLLATCQSLRPQC